MQIKNSNIFITATNTDVGKTHITEQLILHYSKIGFRVGVIKPIETGVKNHKPLDGIKLSNLINMCNPEFKIFPISEIVPYQFKLPASPYVAKQDVVIDIYKIRSLIKEMKNYCDILIIEGAGGLMVPIEINYFMVDLIKELDCKTLLISPSNLGSINDTLLSIEKLKNSDIDFEWTINLHKDIDSFSTVTEPFYKNYFHNFNIFQNDKIELAEKLIYR